MCSSSRVSLAIKAVQQLGIWQTSQYAWYQMELRSGYLRYRTRVDQEKIAAYSGTHELRPLFELPEPGQVRDVIGEEGVELLSAEAVAILEGKVRLFGSAPVPLQLASEHESLFWTGYEKQESGYQNITDIKFQWEPARFGWAYSLGRAYLLSEDERYPEAFWKYVEQFANANPPNYGPNWVSAQEVALRLISLVFAAHLFADSSHSTIERRERTGRMVAEHAARIPATLSYARAQNNNHLLSEGAGLYTAGVSLPDHPQAQRWRESGWRWFVYGLETQIAGDGAYIQHSSNYQRLMLQLALWVDLVSRDQPEALPGKSRQLIADSARWLLDMCDRESGHVPNLGPNDGAYIMPLSIQPFLDYRPVLQAAGVSFLNERPFRAGAWDEMALWVSGLEHTPEGDRERGKDDLLLGSSPVLMNKTPHIIKSPGSKSWAYFRAAHFDSRPGHADQLQLDLWWRGLNVALDSGTYLYNAPEPWNNSLSNSAVHNTVTVDGLEQMTRANRFLYLDWAQAKVLNGERNEDGTWSRITAQHDGYRKVGTTHRRTVITGRNEHWTVEDELLPLDPGQLPPKRCGATLQWLLPDWSWEVDGQKLSIASPFGTIEISVLVGQENSLPDIQVFRAGEKVYGSQTISQTWGWYSPTYGTKIPALSFRVGINGILPISVTTKWEFPEGRK